MKCHVCTNDVGEGHQFKLCKNNVHLICSNPEGDEGYGQSVVCFICSKKILYLTSVLYITHPFQSLLNSTGGMGSVGGLGSVGAWLAWVAWFHTILAWVAWIHKTLAWVKKLTCVKIKWSE